MQATHLTLSRLRLALIDDDPEARRANEGTFAVELGIGARGDRKGTT